VLPDRSATLSGHIRLWFLAFAVLVVLAQTSPDGWVKRCSYGLGRCRKSCNSDEKKKENCGERYICFLSHIPQSTELSMGSCQSHSLSQDW
uniref:Beta-defensin n=1 Tax=Castor canadensis TaxID=51338 RepID=A0A8C0X267_CASCN